MLLVGQSLSSHAFLDSESSFGKSMNIHCNSWITMAVNGNHGYNEKCLKIAWMATCSHGYRGCPWNSIKIYWNLLLLIDISPRISTDFHECPWIPKDIHRPMGIFVGSYSDRFRCLNPDEDLSNGVDTCLIRRCLVGGNPPPKNESIALQVL